MEDLYEELTKIKFVHLGRNPIKKDGWKLLKQHFKNELINEEKSFVLTNLSLSMYDSDKKLVQGAKLESSFLEELTFIILKMEVVDLSGQTNLNWTKFHDIVKDEIENWKEEFGQIKLKRLILDNCNIKTIDMKEKLEEILSSTNVELKFSQDETDNSSYPCFIPCCC